MTTRMLLLLLTADFMILVHGLLLQIHRMRLPPRDSGDAGEPLFLTQYVESGNIEEGKRLARVPFTGKLGIKSYAGYFTVNETYNSKQFLWYFPAMVPNNTDAPVVVWLNGGPGASSLYGLFLENGPIMVRNNTFERRKYHWALNHHMIYIDNPVGTGFSFTNDSRGYCTDEVQVGEDLYSTLIQFFKLFPELQQNKFFVSGQSYGGKYVPALAYTIHKKNPDAEIKINLKGIAIGNGLCDPEHQLVYSKYLYQIGLIDWHQAKEFEEYEKKAINHIHKSEWNEAFELFASLFFGETKHVFHNMSGFNFKYNYLHTKDYNGFQDFGPMLQKSEVRKAIHVGEMPFNNGSLVEYYLRADFMKSMLPWIKELLDYYHVVMYNGQLDVILAYPTTVNYLRQFNFTGSDEYKTAKRYVWKVDSEIAGYVKRAGKLVEIMVRNAGHMVPTDQPKWALDLITRFTHTDNFDIDSCKYCDVVLTNIENEHKHP